MKSEHESKPQNPLLVNLLYKQKSFEKLGTWHWADDV